MIMYKIRNLGYDYYPTKERVRKPRKSSNLTSKIVTGIMSDDETLFQKIEYLSRSCSGKLNRKSSYPLGKGANIEVIPFSQPVLTYAILKFTKSIVSEIYSM